MRVLISVDDLKSRRNALELIFRSARAACAGPQVVTRYPVALYLLTSHEKYIKSYRWSVLGEPMNLVCLNVNTFITLDIYNRYVDVVGVRRFAFGHDYNKPPDLYAR